MTVWIQFDVVFVYLFECIYVGVEGFTTQEDHEMISRIEKQLKRRFAIGSQVSEHSIIQDFSKQVRLKVTFCTFRSHIYLITLWMCLLSSLSRSIQNMPFKKSFIWCWGGESCSIACRGKSFTESNREMFPALCICLTFNVRKCLKMAG